MKRHGLHTLFWFVIHLVWAAIAVPASAQPLAGVYAHVRDSDGTKPKPHASVILTFEGRESGSVALAAVQPGEEVTDTGTYSTRGNLITIVFTEMEWEARNKPFQFDGCILVLPFKALSGKAGPGTSTWARRDSRCVQPQAPVAPAQSQATVPVRGFSPFTASEIITDNGRRRTARVFVSEKAVRSEGEENGQKYIAILRLDRGILWLLSVPDRTYTELPFGAAKGGFAGAAGIPLARGCRILGEEKVAGYTCVRQECRIPAGANPVVETRWTASDLGGILIKYTAGSQILELENVRREALDPALFEVPAGYRKVSR